jgi:hypothetical protein
MAQTGDEYRETVCGILLEELVGCSQLQQCTTERFDAESLM